MAIPDYQTLMLPLLALLKDQEEHSKRQVVDTLALQFNLADSERRELLSSGQQPVFDNRVGWARTYLKKAGLIESTQRGYFRITDRGLITLRQNPAKIDRKMLEQYQEFRDFVSIKREKTSEQSKLDNDTKTPEEILSDVYLTIRNNLAFDILDRIKSNSPSLFENIVIDLLVKMGYGGSKDDAGKAIGKTGDEGIDGKINEDKLGLDVIYVQAKRWDAKVGRPEIQKFAGALQGQHARKGIFITTSDFSQEALDFASKIDSKIILIDGNSLAHYMIEYNVGVSTQETYQIKKIDLDYFNEE